MSLPPKLVSPSAQRDRLQDVIFALEPAQSEYRSAQRARK